MYKCVRCTSQFKNKSSLMSHFKRKNPCPETESNTSVENLLNEFNKYYDEKGNIKTQTEPVLVENHEPEYKVEGDVCEYCDNGKRNKYDIKRILDVQWQITRLNFLLSQLLVGINEPEVPE